MKDVIYSGLGKSTHHQIPSPSDQGRNTPKLPSITAYQLQGSPVGKVGVMLDVDYWGMLHEMATVEVCTM